MVQVRQVEAFRAVMLTGAMTAAAETLHITQPAVSRLIRDLEISLRLTLFNRRGNRISPTPEALELFAEVERSFLGLDRLAARADDIRSGRTDSLRIACLPAMATGFLPRFVASFCRSRPELIVHIDGIPSDLVLERVTRGEFDIGLTALMAPRSTLHLTPIKDSVVVVMPLSHPLAAKKVIRAADLEDEKLIVLSSGSYGRHVLEFALGGVRRRQAIETPLSTIACVMAAEGMGVAIVDPFSASDFVGRGVAIRRFEPSVSMGFAIVRSSSRPLSKVAQDFKDQLIAHIDRFLEDQHYIDADPVMTPEGGPLGLAS